MARINSRIFYTKGIKGALLVSAVAVLAAFIFLPAGRSVENNLDVPIVKAGECDPTSDALPCDPIGGGTPVKPKLSSSIIIILDTVPDDSQVFGFSTTGSGISSFSLDDYAGTPLSNTKTFSGLGTGTFTVTEGMVSGFDLVSINCSDPTSNSSGNISTRVATINLGYLETVTCTFINVKRATIHVTKITAPANDTTQFTIDASSSNGGLILNPHRTTLATNHAEDFSVLANKTYSITETVPAGWTKTSDTCQNLSPTPGQTINCSVTNTRKGHLIVQKTTLPGGDSTAFNITASGTGTITGSATGTVTDALDKDYEVTQGIYSVVETVPNGWTKTGDTCQNVSVVAGETKTCLITNTKKGRIIVDKVTNPSSSTQSFMFTTNYGGSFGLTDFSAPNDSGLLVPGIYSVAETPVAGWTQTSAICSDGSPVNAISLQAGEIITCTFVNTFEPEPVSHVIIVLDSVPNDSQDFVFINNFGNGNPVSFDLDDDADGTLPNSRDFVVSSGTYFVFEVIPIGWDLMSATCSDGSPVSAIMVSPGETVSCIFTNTRKGHLIVQKTTLPGGDSTAFNITASGTGTITGSATGTVTDALDKDYEVTQGIYSVVETVPNGWTKTGDTCQNVSVVAGETKTCLITNTKDAPLTGNITVRKDAAPNDLRDFLYTMTGQSNFYLDDDDGVVDKGMFGDIDQPQSKTFLGLAANIDYTISETIPAYWNFGGVNCLNNQDSTPYSGVTNISSSQTSASVTLTLLPGADITCTFINEKFRFPTRTQGFWQTHTRFTSDIFEMYFGVTGMNIGIAPHKGPITNIELSSQSQLFGAYYSNISKKSNNKNRTATDKRRMQLLQQLVTAKLNCAAFNCPVSIQTMIADADSAYASGNAGQISTAIAVLDSYNQSGDTLIISPPYPWPGSATPGISQDLSDIDFWDNP
jgi:hypothetical protein